MYVGLSGLLSKEWNIGEFISRYSYVMPYQILKKPELVLEQEHCGMIDPHQFVSHVFINESVGSYLNASETAGIQVGIPIRKPILQSRWIIQGSAVVKINILSEKCLQDCILTLISRRKRQCLDQ